MSIESFAKYILFQQEEEISKLIRYTYEHSNLRINWLLDDKKEQDC